MPQQHAAAQLAGALSLTHKPASRGLYSLRRHSISQLAETFQPLYGLGVDSACNSSTEGKERSAREGNITAVCEPNV
jgi:hypothetical protein